MFESTLEIVLVFMLLVLALFVAVLFQRQNRQASEVQEQLRKRDEGNQISQQYLRDELKETRLVSSDIMLKLDELETAIAELATKLRQQAAEAPENKIYTKAAKMVSQGATVDEIMTECDLPRAEAELLMSLHQS